MAALKKTRYLLLLVIGALAVTDQARAYDAAYPERWPKGQVVFHLLLGNPPAVLQDGSTSWDQVAGQALERWNQYLDRIHFVTAAPPVNSVTFGDGRNSASWGLTADGNPFGTNTAAITRTRFVNDVIVESDVYFNTARSWNSYRGIRQLGIVDFRRVALHEFGHAFGLDHPDGAGQAVEAIMNANVSDVDDLRADDINGAKALYGNLLHSAVDLGGGWYWFEQLGNINLASYDVAADQGWVYHLKLGWLYLTHSGEGNIYWWDLTNGWQYTSLTGFPYLYNFATNSWWFFDTNSGLPGQRWFFDFGSGQWIAR